MTNMSVHMCKPDTFPLFLSFGNSAHQGDTDWKWLTRILFFSIPISICFGMTQTLSLCLLCSKKPPQTVLKDWLLDSRTGLRQLKMWCYRDGQLVCEKRKLSANIGTLAEIDVCCFASSPGWYKHVLLKVWCDKKTLLARRSISQQVQM